MVAIWYMLGGRVHDGIVRSSSDALTVAVVVKARMMAAAPRSRRDRELSLVVVAEIDVLGGTEGRERLGAIWS
jgi:hypothetical protein